MRNSDLLRILICPSCKRGKLRYRTDSWLLCETCGYEYKIVEGVPLLLTDDSKENINRFYSEKRHTVVHQDFKKTLRDRFLETIEPPHAINFGHIREKKLHEAYTMASDGKKNRSNRNIRILVIGNLPLSKNPSTIGKEVMAAYETAIRMDIIPKPHIDLVADGYGLPFDGGSLDLVIAQATMKHLSNPNAFVKEVKRVLKENGVFYAEFAYLLPFHRWPGDYLRFTPLGISELLRDFETIEIGFNRGPSQTVADLLTIYLGSLLSLNNQYLYGFFRRVIAWVIHPIKYLDYILVKNKWADLIGQVNYCIAKK